MHCDEWSKFSMLTVVFFGFYCLSCLSSAIVFLISLVFEMDPFPS